MLFNSFEFIVLALVTLAIYYIPMFSRFQKFILIISSFIFYGWSDPSLCLLLFISIVANAVFSYYVCAQQQRKTVLFFGVAFNLMLLGIFKYNRLLANTFGLAESENPYIKFFVSIPLPIGISFYSFQGISLVVDSYRAKSRDFLNAKNLKEHTLNTTFFKSFFPQLIAGPIVKAHDFLFQIKVKTLKDVDFLRAMELLILGYFFKCVVADNLKDYTYWISYPFFKAKSSLDLIIMLYGYSFQIFSDFAGYSYIAMGLAELFGYKFMYNFDFPYISRSFSEFWRRWHISLSTFLKEYLYIPLGGNKKSETRTYLNLFIVMFLGGLWHGAAWSYAIWGTLHGLFLAIERKLGGEAKRKKTSLIYDVYKVLFVFTLVSFAWLFFRLPNFNEAIEYIIAIAQNFRLTSSKGTILFIMFFSSPIIIHHLNYEFEWSKKYKIVKTCTYALMLYLIFTNYGSKGSFIYFQF